MGRSTGKDQNRFEEEEEHWHQHHSGGGGGGFGCHATAAQKGVGTT